MNIDLKGDFRLPSLSASMFGPGDLTEYHGQRAGVSGMSHAQRLTQNLDLGLVPG